MKTIIEYLQSGHLNKQSNKSIMDCFIDIDAKDANKPEYKDYIMFRNGSWRVVKYIKEDDLFNTDIHETIDALKKLFKDTIGDIFVEMDIEKNKYAVAVFEKVLTISLNGYVLDQRICSEEANKVYDYFNSFKK